MNAHRGVEVLIYSFFNLGSRWRWVADATPWAVYPSERPTTHCTGGLSGPQDRSGQARKISPPL